VAVQVYRCSHCGREVLVRLVAPLTQEEIQRRISEEMRPETPGSQARPQWQERLKDDIWVGVSGSRTHVPREAVPAVCPACGRDSLGLARTVEA
jgi:predicted RNA-binding Zn-ribbon protein involved in translation (DUF1610 family)